ncbi:DUF6089 family protein [Pedobacter glucosidilyticus]|uniref:type IX secretion system protein PorG n=1 Tax=Pedobacter glucosidilyticus TaxID=1122941 RepID=UPI0026F02C34|nr:DUF6089 family protein [Pedobacter glucosidilyticus]
MIKSFWLTFFLYGISTFKLFSQTWELGISAGGMAYQGDLNQHKFYKFNNLGLGGSVKRNFDGYWSLKFSILSGRISANDAQSNFEQDRERNLNFFSNITEGSLLVEFNFFDYGFNFGQSRITPFIFSGVSAFAFNPKTTLNGREVELKLFNTEGQPGDVAYKTIATAIPLGAGVKYRINEKLNIAAEFGFRKANTDYLDDVSQRYPNIPYGTDRAALADRSLGQNKLGNPATPDVKGIQRGDFRKNDTFLFAGITLSYTFVRQNCPLF